MPRVFKAGSYWVYFWSDESRPLEPVHVHIVEGAPKPGATKVWITRAGKCLLDNNDSDIDLVILRRAGRGIAWGQALSGLFDFQREETDFFWHGKRLENEVEVHIGSAVAHGRQHSPL